MQGGRREDDSQANPVVGRQKKDKGPKDKSKRRGSGPGKRIFPFLITLGIIVGLVVVYSGIRAARQSLDQGPTKSLTLPKTMGDTQIGQPEGWSQARMQNVAKASGRWGIGPEGSKNYALFITRYPLRAVPKDKAAMSAVRQEAQRSLIATGAAGKKLTVRSAKLGGAQGWQYSFDGPGMNIVSLLLVHTQGSKAALYQISCQSPKGSKGKAFRDKCSQAWSALKFSQKRA